MAVSAPSRSRLHFCTPISHLPNARRAPPGPAGFCIRKPRNETKILPGVSEALITSPMKPAAFTMPEVLLAAIDKAAAADDPSAPNRSSIVRRAVIQFLRQAGGVMTRIEDAVYLCCTRQGLPDQTARVMQTVAIDLAGSTLDGTYRILIPGRGALSIADYLRDLHNRAPSGSRQAVANRQAGR